MHPNKRTRTRKFHEQSCRDDMTQNDIIVIKLYFILHSQEKHIFSMSFSVIILSTIVFVLYLYFSAFVVCCT